MTGVQTCALPISQASVPRGPVEAGEWSGRAALAGEQRGQRSGAAMPCPCRGSGASWGQQGRGARPRRSRVESAAFSSQGSGEEGSGRGHGGAKHGEHCSHAALRLQEEDEEALADSPLNFFSYLQLGPSLFLLLPFKTSEF